MKEAGSGWKEAELGFALSGTRRINNCKGSARWGWVWSGDLQKVDDDWVDRLGLAMAQADVSNHTCLDDATVSRTLEKC